MHPLISFGSRGESVALLQRALNAWPGGTAVPLVDDGAFGPLTLGRVRGFQLGSRLTADGIVGPMTWKELQPLIDGLVDLITPSKDEMQLRERIVQSAEIALATFGWPVGSVSPDPLSPRIAAAIWSREVFISKA